MSIAQFVVTSKTYGDFAGYTNDLQARGVAHDLNTRLYDTLVYFPLVRDKFVVTPAQEAELHRQFNEEAFEVVQIIEV